MTLPPSRRHRSGIVYLVGAGPGDPGLLTLRGADLLAQADVVVYDYLANPQLLRHCPRAERIYVGKKAASHTLTQDQINQLLLEQARRGRRVVRLKGGDPFVFGRGGEEAEALVDAGIPFEVVPGITAAIGGPAYAGIPVTHRDLNSSFTFITGHEKEEAYQDPQARQREAAGGSSDIDWATVAKLPCIAFYMGVKSLTRICARLIEHGMDSAMPAATIRWGTRTQQRTVVGTVGNLPDRVQQAGLQPPALTIIGRVVALREKLNWFESRPLFGQTIVVTRTRQQASDLSGQLAELGATVLEAPTIELAPAADPTAVDRAITRAGEFDWVIFTSANGVSQTRDRLLQANRDARVFAAARIAAIGQVTAQAVRDQLCLRVDLCPPTAIAEALAEALAQQSQIAGKRFLLLRADIARPVLRQRLVNAGAAEVQDVPVYETRPAGSLPPEVIDAIDAGQVTWVTFTSSSTARNLVNLLGGEYLRRLAGVKIASIGPITSQTLGELGLQPTAQSPSASIDALVDAICAASGLRGA